jgi:hypothetical protein
MTAPNANELKTATAQLAAVSVSGLFLRRCGGGKGGSHPFDVDDRFYVLAVAWIAESLYDAVEA